MNTMTDWIWFGGWFLVCGSVIAWVMLRADGQFKIQNSKLKTPARLCGWLIFWMGLATAVLFIAGCTKVNEEGRGQSEEVVRSTGGEGEQEGPEVSSGKFQVSRGVRSTGGDVVCPKFQVESFKIQGGN